jgi:hypothetical protein
MPYATNEIDVNDSMKLVPTVVLHRVITAYNTTRPTSTAVGAKGISIDMTIMGSKCIADSIPDYIVQYIRNDLGAAEKIAVREADVYAGLKTAAARRGEQPLSWAEFHQLRKRLGWTVGKHAGTDVLYGIGWRSRATCRPEGARTYKLSTEQALVFLGQSNARYEKEKRMAYREYMKRYGP